MILVSITALVIGTTHTAFGQVSRTYYIYADPVPDYASSYADNAIPNAVSAWESANPNLQFYMTENQQQADLIIQWVKDFGQIRNGQEMVGKFVQVGLGDSNCGGTWQPFSSNYVTQITEHEIGHFLGFQHTTNPNDLMYGGPLSNYGYGTITWTKDLNTGSVWFVPSCTVKSVTSFAYNIGLSRQDDAFDFYFVPSQNEYNNFINNQQFQYYQGNGCSGTNLVSYNGFCQGVAKGSGLLVVLHSHILLNHPDTVTAQLTEQSTVQASNIPVVSEQVGVFTAAQPSSNPPTPINTQNFPWTIGVVIIGLVGGGIIAMRYAMKR